MQGQVGAELGAEQSLDMPVDDFLELRRLLPAVRLRMLVLPSGRCEYASLRQRSPVCGRPAKRRPARMQRTFAQARAGMTEAEVARLMTVASLEAGADSPWVIITSGAGNYDLASKLPSSVASSPAISSGWIAAVVSAATGLISAGPGWLGGDAAQQDAQNRIHEITMLGVDAVRPGITTGEVARRCKEALARLDLPITSCVSDLAARVGHGIGLMTTELPHVAEDDETVLEPGMIVTIEPGVATPFGIFHVEENVLVTEQGHEVLSQAPRELATIAVR